MAIYHELFPHHSKRAATVCSLVGFGGLALTFEAPDQLLFLIKGPFPAMYALIAAVGAKCWGDYLAERKVESYFFKLPKWSLKIDDLGKAKGLFGRLRAFLKGYPQDDRMFLLGRGFAWRSRHAQMLHDLDLDVEFKERVETALSVEEEGLPFYHAIGMDEEENIYIPKEATVAHIGVEGTTRVGKTRVLEVLATQQILRTDAAVVVIDPKGDRKLADTLYDAACRAGKKFRFFSPVHPEVSETINPILRYDDPKDPANRLIRMIQPQEGVRDNFINFALGELITVCEALDYIGEPMSFRRLFLLLSVRAEMERFYARVKRMNAEDQTERGKRNVENLQRVIEHPSEHYKKLIITITPTLAMLSTGHMERLLCSPTPSLEFHRAVRNGDVILFSLASMVNKERAEQLARVILEDFVSFIGRVYAYEDPKDFPEIYLHADEVGDYLSPAFINLLNKGGGAGFRAACYFQNEEDWAATLGNKDSALRALGNLNTRIWLRTLSEMGIQNLVRNSPVANIIMTQETVARTPRPDNPDLLFQTSANSRTTPMEKPMLDGRILKSLPKGQGFAFIGGKYYKVRFPFLEEPSRSFFKERGIEFSDDTPAA